MNPHRPVEDRERHSPDGTFSGSARATHRTSNGDGDLKVEAGIWTCISNPPGKQQSYLGPPEGYPRIWGWVHRCQNYSVGWPDPMSCEDAYREHVRTCQGIRPNWALKEGAGPNHLFGHRGSKWTYVGTHIWLKAKPVGETRRETLSLEKLTDRIYGSDSEIHTSTEV